MEDYLKDLEKLIAQITCDQKDHLLRSVQEDLLQSIVETSTFNNAYIDATRNIKQILTQAASEIKMTIDHFKK